MNVGAGLGPVGRYRPRPITRPEDTGNTFRYRTALVLGTLGSVGYVALVAWIMTRSTYGTWIAFVMAPTLFVVSLPFLHRMLDQVEPDELIRKLVVAGLAAKLTAAFVRFGVNEFVLGHADAEAYYLYGSTIAAEFRQLIFGGPAYQAALPDLTGTRFIRLLTGLIYVVTGSTHLGGYVIYSFLSYWGLYLMYRAYRIAVPDGLRRRYVALLFFLPSTVFWPSSIGKEAWMTTMLGIGSYGVARLLTQQRYGYTAIFPAMAGMAIVRPHVAALFGAALGAAFVLRRSQGGGNVGRKVIGLLVLTALAGAVATQLQTFFELDGLNAQQVFDETARRSSTGGSEFDAVQPTSIIGLPWAIVTVLFRPFLFEARSAAMLIAALEGTVLIGLFLYNLPRLARLPALILKRPYLGYVLVYTILFTFAFSSINNFGILSRQRAQLFPLAIALVTIPFTPALQTRSERTAALAGSRGPAGDDGRGDDPVIDREEAGGGRRSRSGVPVPFSPEDDRPTRWARDRRSGARPGVATTLDGPLRSGDRLPSGP